MIKKYIKFFLGESTITKIKFVLKSKDEKELIKREEKDLFIKRRNFYLQFLDSGDMYFDVGANYGIKIEPIINDGFKIIAVEPQPQCIKYLTKKFGDKITIVPKGLGEKKGIQTMYLSNAHAISSFSQEWISATRESGRFSQFNWNKEQLIEMETLDNLISKYGKPQFIKIDVEGYEYEVLKGLTQAIRTISFEYTIPERRDSILNCIDRIIDIGRKNEVLFNYSIGESLEWALDEWVSAEKMKEEINLDRFIKSDFGDIYVKTASKKR